MVKIRFKFKKPKSMDVAAFAKAIDDGLKDEQKEDERRYRKITDKFSTPVDWKKDGPKGTSTRSIRTFTDDVRFVVVDEGSSHRWAVMSVPFVPKTTKRRLTARKGVGGAVIRGKRAMQSRGIAPRPGVEAREISLELARIREPKFGVAMRKKIKEAADKAF